MGSYSLWRKVCFFKHSKHDGFFIQRISVLWKTEKNKNWIYTKEICIFEINKKWSLLYFFQRINIIFYSSLLKNIFYMIPPSANLIIHFARAQKPQFKQFKVITENHCYNWIHIPVKKSHIFLRFIYYCVHKSLSFSSFSRLSCINVHYMWSRNENSNYLLAIVFLLVLIFIFIFYFCRPWICQLAVSC